MWKKFLSSKNKWEKVVSSKNTWEKVVSSKNSVLFILKYEHTFFFLSLLEPFLFPLLLKGKNWLWGLKENHGNACEMLSQQCRTCFPNKNQWRVVFYEIQLLTYNGSAHQHSPGAYILLHFPSFNR